MAHIEGTYEQVNERLGSIDARFAGIDRRFASIDARFDSIDARFNSIDLRLDHKIDQRFMWTIGVVMGTWLTTILAVFLHHP